MHDGSGVRGIEPYRGSALPAQRLVSRVGQGRDEERGRAVDCRSVTQSCDGRQRHQRDDADDDACRDELQQGEGAANGTTSATPQATPRVIARAMERNGGGAETAAGVTVVGWHGSQGSAVGAKSASHRMPTSGAAARTKPFRSVPFACSRPKEALLTSAEASRRQYSPHEANAHRHGGARRGDRP